MGCRLLLYGLSSIIYALSRKYHKRADARRRGGRHQYLHLITPLLLLAIQNAKNIMKGVEPYLCDGHLPSLCCCGVFRRGAAERRETRKRHQVSLTIFNPRRGNQVLVCFMKVSRRPAAVCLCAAHRRRSMVKW